MGNGIYNAKKELGIGKSLLLGLQHVFAMSGATVLVPLLTGLSVSVTLFCAGLATLWFHLVTKRKVPIFLGSSFAFLGAFATIAQDANGRIIYENLPYCTGGIMIAGLVYVVLAIFIKIFGVKKVMKLFPPVVTGPIIILIGLILAPSALTNITSTGDPMRISVGILAIILIMAITLFGKGMLRIMSILASIVICYVVALLLGMVNFNFEIRNIVAIPPFVMPQFRSDAIITFVVVAIAAVVEHMGDIAAISATCDKNFIEDPGLPRTLLGDGIGTTIAGFLGGPANTTYSENTGVVALTKVYDPFVIRVAAVIAIIISFFPIVDNVIRTIPSEIIGGISFILYGMISATGLRTLIENKVDFVKSRNLFVAAIILVSGLAFEQSPLVVTLGSITLTFKGLACAAIFGIIVNAILPDKD